MLNFIRGAYRFEIIGISPERFINIANRRRLRVFNLHCSGGRMFGCVASSNFHMLLGAAEKAGVQLVITNSFGLPFLLKKYKSRIGFVFGFGLFCLTLWYLSLFVWSVNVVNLPEEYSESAAEALYSVGIRQGVMFSRLDGTLLQKELEELLPDFDFIKVSRVGCYAEVYFSPSAELNYSVDEGSPCDVVASTGGEIVSIIAKAGTPMVEEGDVVYTGDVLISGLFEGNTGRIDLVHSYGEVTAITDHTFTTTVKYRQTATEPTGRVVTISRLIAFGMEIPLFYSTPDGNYSRTYEEYQAEIFGFKLPIYLRREYWTELCYVEKDFTLEECIAQAEEILDDEMSVDDEDSIISIDQTVNEITGGIRVTRYVTLLEEISLQREILFDEYEETQDDEVKIDEESP